MYCLPVKALQYTHCALCCGVNIIILWGVMFPNNCVTGAHALSIWLDFWMKVIAGLCGWFDRNSYSVTLQYPIFTSHCLHKLETNSDKIPTEVPCRQWVPGQRSKSYLCLAKILTILGKQGDFPRGMSWNQVA